MDNNLYILCNLSSAQSVESRDSDQTERTVHKWYDTEAPTVTTGPTATSQEVAEPLQSVQWSGSQLSHCGDVTNESQAMDLDPITALFGCTSPNCQRSEIYNKANDIKADRLYMSSSEIDSSLLSPKHYFNCTHNPYNGPPTQNPVFSSSTCFPPQSSSPNYAYGTSAYTGGLSACHSPQSSASYVIHPQIQMNATNAGHQSSQSGHSPYVANPMPEHIQHSSHMPTASMSVNLSMNMTMGFNNPDAQQFQWSAPASNYHNNNQNQSVNSSAPYHPPASHMHPPYLSPSPSYTFTAEIRPTSEHMNTSLPPIEKEFGGVCNMKNVQRTNSNNQSRSSETYHYHIHRYMKAKSQRNVSQSMHSTSNRETFEKNTNNICSTNLCRICGKTYARPSTLKTHMRTHSGEKPYRCNTCNKSFSQAANLTAHIRTHSGEKPFRCPVCERRFSQSSSVTTHMRTHSGERPYRCCSCKKAFSDSSTLTKHLRIHSGEKPYQCHLCLLRFSQSGNLNRHMRIHA